MKTYINPPFADLKEILIRPTISLDELEGRVSSILKDVKEKGDAALTDYTSRFDKWDGLQLRVSEAETAEADSLVSPELKAAIQQAAANIEKFHSAQYDAPKPIETVPGVLCWRKSVGIEKVGLYIPGGTAPLFSTVLMLAIPARLAGCKKIVLCSPAGADGKIHPAILWTAKFAGVTEIFKLGGAQAIAAMALGTETVPQVYKIFGPGNQYVTMAKMLVNRLGVAIDMPAGPSEVMVVADETAVPAFVASDLLSQAEHGIDSQVVLVAKSLDIVKAVEAEIAVQLQQLPRGQFAAKALENSKILIYEEDAKIVDAINAYAPEHLILSVANYDEIAEQVVNSGSIFLGNYTPESAGDYASGTNHTLPTNGYARAYSGVSLDSFVKKISMQRITKEGIQLLGPAIEKMAAAEMLDAHKNAVSLRIK